MKRIFLLILICLIGLSSYAQKIINNPKFHAATADNVSITRIELQDTCTILHFTVMEPPGGSFNIPPESYIQPSDGGEKLQVLRAVGANLGESVSVSETGKVSYKLFFPALKPDVPMIDFGEGSETGSWFFYSLELIAQQHTSIFPDEIEGNWFRTDGSREWMYGFQSPVVLYDGKLFEGVALSKKGSEFILILTEGGHSITLYLKTAPGKELLIGTDPNNLERFSREPKIRADYKFNGDEEFQTPVIKAGTARYSGYIKGYLPKMGKTGMIYVNNVFANAQTPILINISENGRFDADVPLEYPHGVFLRLLGYSKSIFLEPGKSVFNFIDMTSTGRQSKQGSCLFMGELARANTDLQAAEKVGQLRFDQIIENIEKMSLVQFKDWMIETGKVAQEAFDSFVAGYPMCKKALQIKQLEITYSIYENILSYYMYKRSTPQNAIQKPVETEKPDSTFYFFLPADEVNSQVSLVSNYYDGLINRLVFHEVVRSAKLSYFPALLDSVNRIGIAISATEKEMLNELAAGKPLTGTAAVSKEIAGAWTEFSAKHTNLISATSTAVYHEKVSSLMDKYFRLKPGLVTDFVLSQRVYGLMNSALEPLNSSMIQLVNQRIVTPEIRMSILAASEEMERNVLAKQAENKAKTGFVVHGSPAAKADSLFEAIISKFPGKVLFIDFWATWCSPCKEGILRMKPLKEEYLGKDIEFIYITGPSSPQKTYDLMVPDIKGQHFRVDKDGWNFLCSRFKISGIPHYMMVDRKGKIIQGDIDSKAHSNEALRKIFDEELTR